jgi:hypothetical protein
MITDVMSSKIATKQQALRVATQINKLVESGVIPKASAAAFYKTLGFKRFRFDLGVSGLIIGAGAGVRYYFNKKAEEAVNQGLKPPSEDVEIAQLCAKADKMNKSDFENKIKPLFAKYDKYDTENEADLNKLRKIQKAVLNAYIANPKSDLNAIANNTDKN